MNVEDQEDKRSSHQWYEQPETRDSTIGLFHLCFDDIDVPVHSHRTFDYATICES